MVCGCGCVCVCVCVCVLSCGEGTQLGALLVLSALLYLVQPGFCGEANQK